MKYGSEEKSQQFHPYHVLRPEKEWHEDMGACLWWHLPVEEPPYVGCGIGAGEKDRYGNPTVCAELIETGWLTHFSPLPDPRYLITTDGTL